MQKIGKVAATKRVLHLPINVRDAIPPPDESSNPELLNAFFAYINLNNELEAGIASFMEWLTINSRKTSEVYEYYVTLRLRD